MRYKQESLYSLFLLLRPRIYSTCVRYWHRVFHPSGPVHSKHTSLSLLTRTLLLRPASPCCKGRTTDPILGFPKLGLQEAPVHLPLLHCFSTSAAGTGGVPPLLSPNCFLYRSSPPLHSYLYLLPQEESILLHSWVSYASLSFLYFSSLRVSLLPCHPRWCWMSMLWRTASLSPDPV